MNKLQFKALRSQFRKMERDCYRDAFRAEFSTGCNGATAFSEKMRELEHEFLISSGFDFFKTRKPTAINRIVSLKVVRKLNYPDWSFEEIKWN